MWLYWLVVLAYIGAAASISTRLFHQQGPMHRFTYLLAVGALVGHMLLLRDTILIAPGQDLSITNVASLIAWVITISMTLASFSLQNALMLPMVYGFSALIVAMQALIPAHHIMHLQLQPALISHITIALLAYGCLVIAFLYALQLSYINFRLKHHQSSLLHSSLPPLMTVEAGLFKLLQVGTLLLTLSLLTGFVFLDNMLGSGQAHKTILSIIAWLIYVILLAGHRLYGWRGRPVIIATISGAILLSLAYFGSRFVKQVILA